MRREVRFQYWVDRESAGNSRRDGARRVAGRGRVGNGAKVYERQASQASAGRVALSTGGRVDAQGEAVE